MIGNKYLHFDLKADGALDSFKKIKLADVLAASSCFPVGFEPLIYPRDFLYQEGVTIKELREAVFYQSYDLQTHHLSDLPLINSDPKEKKSISEFALMDGRIADNRV